MHSAGSAVQSQWATLRIATFCSDSACLTTKTVFSPLPPSSDGLLLLAAPAHAEDEIGFEADAVSISQGDGSMLATGNVVMTQAGMTLHADEVRYNRENDVAVATGNVRFIDNDGAIHRAEVMTLDT